MDAPRQDGISIAFAIAMPYLFIHNGRPASFAPVPPRPSRNWPSPSRSILRRDEMIAPEDCLTDACRPPSYWSAPMKPYTIVLADDHALLREGLKKIIAEAGGLEVIGEAADGLTLLRILKRNPPDLVILDITMPKLRGIEAAQQIRKQCPGVAVLFLSMHKGREYLQKALATGARGYMAKEDTGNELIHAIQTIRRGSSYVSPTMMAALSQDPLGLIGDPRPAAEDPLTPRERQILQLIAEGKTGREISQILFISIHTVHNHRKNIRRKLAVHKTTDLLKYALKHGYDL